MNVFISHASADTDWARKLAEALKRAGLDAWDPSANITPGENWSLEVGKALEKAGAMVVLLSPAARRRVGELDSPCRPKEVFVSHASRDAKIIERVVSVLDRHGIAYWYSRRRLIAAQQWHDENRSRAQTV
jgi:hypothetical protein